MKKNSYLLLLLISLLGILTYISCKKTDNRAFNENSNNILVDPIKKVSIDKLGNATIETKSGKQYNLNVLVKASKKDILLSKTDLSDTTTGGIVTQTFKIPLNINNNSFAKSKRSSFSSISESESGSSGAYFTYTIVRHLTNGYCTSATVSVWPAVLPVSDFTIRATVLAVTHSGWTVTWDANYQYIRNYSAFQSTQVTYTNY